MEYEALRNELKAIKRAAEAELVEAYESMELEELEVRIKTLEHRWAKVEQLSPNVMASAEVSIVDMDEMLECAERRYFRASAALRRQIKNLSNVQAGEVQPAALPINVQVQMPVTQTAVKNTWGEFKGDVLKWQSFRDRFVAAVHENEQISPAFKFSYLKKSLVGDAASTLGEWQLTDENYGEAWARLNEVYGKTYPICRELLRQFFALPKMSKASASGLLNMVNTTYECMRQLKAQGLPSEHWGMIIVHCLHERLDPSTARQWELARQSEMPEWEAMARFLERQANAMPAEQSDINDHLSTSSATNATVRRARGQAPFCEACSGPHPMYRCEQFLSLNLSARKNFVFTRKLCPNCLRKGHGADGCFKGACGHCPGKKHNSVLCDASSAVANAAAMNMNIDKGGKSKINNKHYKESFIYEPSDILLPTVLVKLEIGSMSYGPVRALIDTGAQPNMMCASFQESNNLICHNSPKSVLGIGGSSLRITSYIRARIRAHFHSEQYIEEVFWVLPKSSGWPLTLPCKRIEPLSLNGHIVRLADPGYWLPSPVELLIGAGAAARAISAIISRNEMGIVLFKSIFGAIVFGANVQRVEQSVYANVAQIECTDNEALDGLLQKLWQSKQVNEYHRARTLEEQMVEDNFVSTYKRDHTGRFIVTIPLKEDLRNFGSSRAIALKRFFMLEKRLARHQEIRAKYCAFMKEYEELGHMRRASALQGIMTYYIPHHCVTKKFRVVFDASCATDTGVSLNKVQLLGEKLQKDLFELVMRFRRHKVAISADVRMMFRQIQIDSAQWDLQRIFWRESQTEPLREYWLTVVTYGMTSSAHNAVRALVQCARDASSEHAWAAKVIEEDFYMDDCVSGADTVEKAIFLANDMKDVLKGGGFELRKWKSNSPEVIKSIEHEQELSANSEHEQSMLLSEEEMTSVLGLKWLIGKDMFTYEVKAPELPLRITKRLIVSRVAQLYDPNGFITPVTIKGKIIIQDIWKLGIDWDDEVPQGMKEQWSAYWSGIRALEQFKISRWIGTGPTADVQVHGFSDASGKAYGAVIYARVQRDERIQTNLLVAKARVAPLKCISIPRLELAAAKLLAQLLNNVLSEMGWERCEYTLWCDSQVVLHWIRKNTANMKVFVANRVADIQKKTKVERWRYINTKYNPADLVSRGVSSEELVSNQLWLHGPKWLSMTEHNWPENIFRPAECDLVREEMKVNLVVAHVQKISIFCVSKREPITLLEYVSKLERAVRILAFVLRFIAKVKQVSKKRKLTRNTKVVLAPTGEEKLRATELLVRQEQEEHFYKEQRALLANGHVQSNSDIESLKPIIDGHGIIRVGGRIDRANEPYEMKHPIIIKNNSRLAWLIYEEAHRITRHGGVQVMMRYIRQRYWVPRMRSGLRSFVHGCIVCTRYNAKFEQQLMSELPAERVQIGKAFLHSGVDYAGPFMVKVQGQSKTPKKCWVAIFVCLKTRAVHIDVVTDLTSVAFIACFERFICRRGRCERIYSDNGTAFVGASKELRKAVEKWQVQEVFDHLSVKGTDWRFMVPAAPHQGGIYEAAVKSMKFHLKRIVGLSVMTLEQFTTLLCEIEAILNSRPLTPLSDDPNDVQALTPGHFLIGEPLVVPLPFVTEELKDTAAARLWQARQNMVRHFWLRWREEYLGTLQERKKWRRERAGVQVGRLVLIKSEIFPPAQWALGRIKELIKSKDGLVRSVVVKTATTSLTRPVTKICALPVEDIERAD